LYNFSGAYAGGVTGVL